MDIHQLEYAARIVFDMCIKHPEICPHDWRWKMTETLSDGSKKVYYVCCICGSEKSNIMTEEEYKKLRY